MIKPWLPCANGDFSGTVGVDETYYPVVKSQMDRKEDGTKYRGLSHNQICIGVATDKRSTICFVEGFGKPSQKKSFEAFSSHIAPGSTLIHDGETTHKKLVSALNLTSQAYAADSLKSLKDGDNPLDLVNDIHDRLKSSLMPIRDSIATVYRTTSTYSHSFGIRPTNTWKKLKKSSV